jgi:hypothetical protein
MDKLRVRVAGLVLAVTALAALLLPREQANASPAATGGTVTRQIAVSTLARTSGRHSRRSAVPARVEPRPRPSRSPPTSDPQGNGS